VRFTIRHPFGMAMVYSSGKYVCMGGKSTVDMVTIARKVARKIQRIGNQPGMADYKVRHRSERAR
jgi:TATA-box binding protein (TBP) (component of TFIID and TFIIIB)